jgi:RimJ/RimL family protein N-acetyltransferase
MSTLSTLAGTGTPSTAQTLPPKPERVPVRPRNDGEYIDVVPYDARFDAKSAQALPYFWQRLKDAGLLELYYPGQGDYSFAQFVRLLSGDVNAILFVIKDPDGNVQDFVGLATWAPLDFGGQQVGNAGFLFLPEYWERATTLEAARRGMKYWFEEMEPRLNMALGMNPSGNHLVQRFLHGLGWTRVGQLPIPQYYGGTHSDLVIWYYTREQYERDKGAA